MLMPQRLGSYPTVSSTRQRDRKIGGGSLILVLALALTGCGLDTNLAGPTTAPDVSAGDQPTYTVQRGEVSESVSFSGRALPVTQEYVIVRKAGLIRTLYAAPGDVVQAGQNLADLEGIDELQQQKALADLSIQRAQTELEIAQLNVDLFKKETPAFSVGYEEELAIKQHQLTLAQLAVTEAQLRATELDRMLQESVITSPLTGQLRFLDIAVGDEVQAYDHVGIVADVSRLDIGADLPKEILSQLAEGMTVSVAVANNPGQILSGTIRQLPAPYGSETMVTGRSPSDAYAWISLDISLAEAGLALDDLVSLSAILHHRGDTLWLPPQAIRSFEGQTFVIIQENGFQRRVEVQTGLRNADQVEILDGLTEGQVILGQ